MWNETYAQNFVCNPAQVEVDNFNLFCKLLSWERTSGQNEETNGDIVLTLLVMLGSVEIFLASVICVLDSVDVTGLALVTIRATRPSSYQNKSLISRFHSQYNMRSRKLNSFSWIVDRFLLRDRFGWFSNFHVCPGELLIGRRVNAAAAIWDFLGQMSTKPYRPLF